MNEKRITIRIPFEIWKSLRELQTEGKISSIQEAAVTSMSDLIESGDAAIIIKNSKYSFGCVGCYEAGQYIIYLMKERRIPTLEIEYPSDEEEAKIMVRKIKDFLENL